MLEFFPDTRDLILERSVKGGLSGQLRKVKSEAWHWQVGPVGAVGAGGAWHNFSPVSALASCSKC
jgi:hypothetical protein